MKLGSCCLSKSTEIQKNSNEADWKVAAQDDFANLSNTYLKDQAKNISGFVIRKYNQLKLIPI